MNFKVMISGLNRPFEVTFKSQLNAEVYIHKLESKNDIFNLVIETDFESTHTEEEVEAEIARQEKLIIEANRLQKQAYERTRANMVDDCEYNPCETCGKKHKNYECCDKCNYDSHVCHFCGDTLGHTEVSACYILEGIGE